MRPAENKQPMQNQAGKQTSKKEKIKRKGKDSVRQKHTTPGIR